MDVDATGAMSHGEQVRCAVEEGMKNVARAIFGDGAQFIVTYSYSLSHGSSNSGQSFAEASAVGDSFSARARLPISYPDAEHGNYRIADRRFVVEVIGVNAEDTFAAWCENNPSLACKTIVRRCSAEDKEVWLIADSLDDERIFSGVWQNLPLWAKQIVAEKWAHLPHVCIDTERRPMQSKTVIEQGEL